MSCNTSWLATVNQCQARASSELRNFSPRLHARVVLTFPQYIRRNLRSRLQKKSTGLSLRYLPDCPSCFMFISTLWHPSLILSSRGAQHRWGGHRFLRSSIPKYHLYSFFLASVKPFSVRQQTLLDSFFLMPFPSLLPLSCLGVPYSLKAPTPSSYLSRVQPYWRPHKAVIIRVNKCEILFTSAQVV